MPDSANEGIAVMLNWVKCHDPKSILDIGVGSGKYGKLLRTCLTSPYLIGIEAWHPYVARFGLREIYDQVIVADVLELEHDRWPHVDVVILGDVLEHMPERAAKLVWDYARVVARKTVVMSIPIIHYPQGAEEGNPFEVHVVPDWTHDRVLNTFPGIVRHWTGTVVGRYEAVPS